jgi:putative hydrolase of the HAD superfamily
VIKAILFDCYGVVLDVYTNQQQTEVVEYIASLKGRYRRALVSNVPHRANIERHFAHGELDKLFDTIIPSGEVGYEKPQPEIYQLAADQLGVKPEECLFVDDIGRFCEGAAAVGMQTVLFFHPQFGLEELKRKVAELDASNH